MRSRNASSTVNLLLAAQPLEFRRAAAYSAARKAAIPMQKRLKLYALYKQALEGDAPEAAPSWAQIIELAKHAAWSAVRGLPADTARLRYVDAVDEISGGTWRSHPAAILAGEASASTGDGDLGAAAGPLSGRVSISSTPPIQPPAGGGGGGGGGGGVGERALRARVAELEAALAALQASEKSGWLHKFSPGAGSWVLPGGASRWPRRYFVLKSNTLVYYLGEGHREAPRRSLPMTNVVLVDEGVKETRASDTRPLFGAPSRRQYHIFSLYLNHTLESHHGPGAGALLRLSCSSSAEARQWIDCLLGAGAQPAGEALLPTPTSSLAASPVLTSAAAAAPPSAAPPERASSRRLSRRDSRSKRKAPLDPFLFPASRPMHVRAQPSLLSHEGQSQSDFSGLLNLGFIILFSTHMQLLLENFLKYGLLVPLPWSPAAGTPLPLPPPPPPAPRLLSWLTLRGLWRNHPPLAPPPAGGVSMASLHNLCASLWPTARALALYFGPLLLGIGAAWLIERSAIRTHSRGPRVSDAQANALHALNLALTLLLPCAYSYWGDLSYGAGIVLLLLACTLFMKLTSWAHAHHDLRLANAEALEESAAQSPPPPGATHDFSSLAATISRFATDVQHTESAAHYPHTVTMPRLLYFVFAPTLCYQEAFPRSPSVRPVYVLSLLLRGLVMCLIIVFISVQMIHPLLRNSEPAVVARDMPKLLERLIKLALPVTYVWLAGFYVFFHVWMNLLAELLRFGDRLFYKAWWNAVTFEAYWRLWNLPVHHWIARHVYFPALRKRLSKAAVGFIAFTVSAVFHELVIALPLKSGHMPLAFLAMMAQVPLVAVSAAINARVAGTPFAQLGNYLFWIAFCFLGQPAAVLLYYVHCTGVLYH